MSLVFYRHPRDKTIHCSSPQTQQIKDLAIPGNGSFQRGTCLSALTIWVIPAFTREAPLFSCTLWNEDLGTYPLTSSFGFPVGSGEPEER